MPCPYLVLSSTNTLRENTAPANQILGVITKPRHPERSVFQRSRRICGCLSHSPHHKRMGCPILASLGWDSTNPNAYRVIPSEAFFSGAEGPAFAFRILPRSLDRKTLADIGTHFSRRDWPVPSCCPRSNFRIAGQPLRASMAAFGRLLFLTAKATSAPRSIW